MTLSRRQAFLVGALVTVFVALMVTVIRGDRSKDLILKVEPISIDTDVTVYIGGAVHSPGLYTFSRGARLSEALELAAPDINADLASLSMASVLVDGQQINVARLADQNSALGGVAVEPVQADSAGATLINVNTASSTELERLPGVGPAIAARIIDHRDEQGPFATLDDLAAVSGISARMVEELRELATVGH